MVMQLLSMEKANKPFKILITAMFDFGHLSSCLGIGYFLVKRGHEVYLAHFPKYKSIIERQGMQFISLYDYADEGAELSDAVPRNSVNFKPRFERSLKMGPFESLKEQLATGAINTGFIKILDNYITENDIMHKILTVQLCQSSQPTQLGLYSRGPPPNSGFSLRINKHWDRV
uniref:Uncharacterized protein n=1 Tax=Tetranychus urticae TaxID=32264 RepID=T1KQI6_TETUR